jgi:hypothetical protein
MLLEGNCATKPFTGNFGIDAKKPSTISEDRIPEFLEAVAQRKADYQANSDAGHMRRVTKWALMYDPGAVKV